MIRSKLLRKSNSLWKPIWQRPRKIWLPKPLRPKTWLKREMAWRQESRSWQLTWSQLRMKLKHARLSMMARFHCKRKNKRPLWNKNWLIKTLKIRRKSTIWTTKLLLYRLKLRNCLLKFLKKKRRAHQTKMLLPRKSLKFRGLQKKRRN